MLWLYLPTQKKLSLFKMKLKVRHSAIGQFPKYPYLLQILIFFPQWKCLLSVWGACPCPNLKLIIRTFLEAFSPQNPPCWLLQPSLICSSWRRVSSCASLLFFRSSCSRSTTTESWPCYREPPHEFQHSSWSQVLEWQDRAKSCSAKVLAFVQGENWTKIYLNV